MPDLLLELFSEEIPARMQGKAADDLRRLITDRLVDSGLTYEGAKAFVTPRRLTLAVEGIPAKQPDIREERKGPRVGAPEAAILGFLRSAGLASISDAKIEKDAKKGEFYVALVERPGRPAIDVIAEIIAAVVREFPWPKSMRWGSGNLTWVRPLQSIVATFGPHTEEPDLVPVQIDGVVAGNTTEGHRFMAPARFKVRRLDDYTEALARAKVVIDPERRRDMIQTDANNLAFAQGYEVIDDPALLSEVAGLVEWPVVLMGSFEEEFLSIPAEVIRATIRQNQKCFVVRNAATGKLANKYILVANIEASDGGAAIVSGNERVIRARLSDAKFFYETDLKTKLEDRLPKFENIIFHEKLGSQSDRIERIEKLAVALAPIVGANVEHTRRAARLCKADLLTEIVGEFPELQGLMGKYYALAQGEDATVARACEDHYKPLGPSDRVPTDPVSVAVALADKLDALVGFWSIDEKPTGSKDPYALRRAALGVVRIVLENALRMSLKMIMDKTYGLLELHFGSGEYQDRDETQDELIEFIAERLKVRLKEGRVRHDLVDAVLMVGARVITPRDVVYAQDDLVLIVRRIEALAKFLDTEDGKNLLAGVKRATNILRIEEKKDGTKHAGAPDPQLYRQAEEWELAAAIDTAKRDSGTAIAREDFITAMAAITKLRPHVDAFFDKVTVNADEPALRVNRLRLLNEIREATRAVADFSQIEA